MTNRIVYLAWANDGLGHAELVGVYANEVDAYQSLSIYYCNTRLPRRVGRVWVERREVEYDGTENESLLLNAIRRILESECGVKSISEAAALYARLTGDRNYDDFILDKDLAPSERQS